MNKLLQTKAYINGAWHETARRFAVHNPANHAVLAEVSDCDAADTERAIAAAAAAQAAWANHLAFERAAILRRWFDLLVQHAEDLAQLITAENGKPLAEARNEVTYGASFIEWYAEEAKRVQGETLPSQRAGQRFFTLRQPLGVVGLITPWNFPFSQVTKKLGPALAAGCTVVLKPAEQTPLTALALAALAEQAGVPAGVLNVLPTAHPAAVGEVLLQSKTVRGISFTGSTAIGQLLMRQAADTVKRVSLELGGNSPFIVFADADLDAAVSGLMQSKFRNAGQTCVCANRIFVEAAIMPAFTAKLLAAVKALNLGDGTNPATTTGPLIDAQGFDKVCALVDEAKAGGARVLAGGQPSALGHTFYEPTVLTDVGENLRIAREEIFGPVAVLYPFSDETSVVQAANDTDYGLAAYCFTNNQARVWRLAEALDFGVVAINSGAAAATNAPFGGLKQSGFGKEGGHEGMDEYLVTKFVPLALF